MENIKMISFIVESTRQLYYATKNTSYYKRKDNNLEEWDFVPSPSDYIESVENILIKENISKEDIISDLGCGISPLLLYLNIISYKNLQGFDNELIYLRKLSLLKVNYKCSIKTYKCNLLRLNKKEKELIKNSKVIYLYMPISNIKKFYNLILKIWNLVEKDTILISFYAMENFDLINKKYYIPIENSNLGYYKK